MKVVAKVYEDVASARHQFIHQQSYRLVVKNHATALIIETLMISNMSKNKKLARHIVSCGWGQLTKAPARVSQAT